MHDVELRKRVQRRAYDLWQAAGSPRGGDLLYWLQAEEEIGGLSVVGEEDPFVAVDDGPPANTAESHKTVIVGFRHHGASGAVSAA